MASKQREDLNHTRESFLETSNSSLLRSASLESFAESVWSSASSEANETLVGNNSGGHCETGNDDVFELYLSDDCLDNAGGDSTMTEAKSIAEDAALMVEKVSVITKGGIKNKTLQDYRSRLINENCNGSSKQPKKKDFRLSNRVTDIVNGESKSHSNNNSITGVTEIEVFKSKVALVCENMSVKNSAPIVENVTAKTGESVVNMLCDDGKIEEKKAKNDGRMCVEGSIGRDDLRSEKGPNFQNSNLPFDAHLDTINRALDTAVKGTEVGYADRNDCQKTDAEKIKNDVMKLQLFSKNDSASKSRSCVQGSCEVTEEADVKSCGDISRTELKKPVSDDVDSPSNLSDVSQSIDAVLSKEFAEQFSGKKHGRELSVKVHTDDDSILKSSFSCKAKSVDKLVDGNKNTNDTKEADKEESGPINMTEEEGAIKVLNDRINVEKSSTTQAGTVPLSVTDVPVFSNPSQSSVSKTIMDRLQIFSFKKDSSHLTSSCVRLESTNKASIPCGTELIGNLQAVPHIVSLGAVSACDENKSRKVSVLAENQGIKVCKGSTLEENQGSRDCKGSALQENQGSRVCNGSVVEENQGNRVCTSSVVEENQGSRVCKGSPLEGNQGSRDCKGSVVEENQGNRVCTSSVVEENQGSRVCKGSALEENQGSRVCKGSALEENQGSRVCKGSALEENQGSRVCKGSALEENQGSRVCKGSALEENQGSRVCKGSALEENQGSRVCKGSALEENQGSRVCKGSALEENQGSRVCKGSPLEENQGSRDCKGSALEENQGSRVCKGSPLEENQGSRDCKGSALEENQGSRVCKGSVVEENQGNRVCKGSVLEENQGSRVCKGSVVEENQGSRVCKGSVVEENQGSRDCKGSALEENQGSRVCKGSALEENQGSRDCKGSVVEENQGSRVCKGSVVEENQGNRVCKGSVVEENQGNRVCKGSVLEENQGNRVCKGSIVEENQGSRDCQGSLLEENQGNTVCKGSVVEENQGSRDSKGSALEENQGSRDCKGSALEENQGNRVCKGSVVEENQGNRVCKGSALEENQGNRVCKGSVLEENQGNRVCKGSIVEENQGSRDCQGSLLEENQGSRDCKGSALEENQGSRDCKGSALEENQGNRVCTSSVVEENQGSRVCKGSALEENQGSRDCKGSALEENQGNRVCTSSVVEENQGSRVCKGDIGKVVSANALSYPSTTDCSDSTTSIPEYVTVTSSQKTNSKETNIHDSSQKLFIPVDILPSSTILVNGRNCISKTDTVINGNFATVTSSSAPSNTRRRPWNADPRIVTRNKKCVIVDLSKSAARPCVSSNGNERLLDILMSKESKKVTDVNSFAGTECRNTLEKPVGMQRVNAVKISRLEKNISKADQLQNREDSECAQYILNKDRIKVPSHVKEKLKELGNISSQSTGEKCKDDASVPSCRSSDDKHSAVKMGQAREDRVTSANQSVSTVHPPVDRVPCTLLPVVTLMTENGLSSHGRRADQEWGLSFCVEKGFLAETKPSKLVYQWNNVMSDRERVNVDMKIFDERNENSMTQKEMNEKNITLGEDLNTRNEEKEKDVVLRVKGKETAKNVHQAKKDSKARGSKSKQNREAGVDKQTISRSLANEVAEQLFVAAEESKVADHTLEGAKYELNVIDQQAKLLTGKEATLARVSKVASETSGITFDRDANVVRKGLVDVASNSRDETNSCFDKNDKYGKMKCCKSKNCDSTGKTIADRKRERTTGQLVSDRNSQHRKAGLDLVEKRSEIEWQMVRPSLALVANDQESSNTNVDDVPNMRDDIRVVSCSLPGKNDSVRRSHQNIIYHKAAMASITHNNLLTGCSPLLVSTTATVANSNCSKSRNRRKRGKAQMSDMPVVRNKNRKRFSPISCLIWRNIRYNGKLIGRKRTLLDTCPMLFSWECSHMFTSRKLHHDRQMITNKLQKYEVRMQRIMQRENQLQSRSFSDFADIDNGNETRTEPRCKEAPTESRTDRNCLRATASEAVVASPSEKSVSPKADVSAILLEKARLLSQSFFDKHKIGLDGSSVIGYSPMKQNSSRPGTRGPGRDYVPIKLERGNAVDKAGIALNIEKETLQKSSYQHGRRSERLGKKQRRNSHLRNRNDEAQHSHNTESAINEISRSNEIDKDLMNNSSCTCSKVVSSIGCSVFEDSIAKLAKSVSKHVRKRKISHVEGNRCTKCDRVLETAKELTRHVLYHIVDKAVDDNFGKEFANEKSRKKTKFKCLDVKESKDTATSASGLLEKVGREQFEDEETVGQFPSKENAIYKAQFWKMHQIPGKSELTMPPSTAPDAASPVEHKKVWTPLYFEVPVKPVKWQCMNCRKKFRGIKELKLHAEGCLTEETERKDVDLCWKA